MTARHGTLTVACLLIVAPIAAAAQQPPGTWPLDSGSVVRLHLRPRGVQTGKLLTPMARDSTTWRFCVYPAPRCVPSGPRYVELPAADVSTVELHRGTRWATGALIGTGIGAVSTITLVATAPNGEVGAPTVAAAGALFTALLALTGGIIGGLIHVWRPVS